MALFSKRKGGLSEPPSPVDINPVEKLVQEMEDVNAVDLGKATSLDKRVRELEAVYKSNKVLGKKILKQLELLRSTMDNLQEHEHVVALQTQCDALTEDLKGFQSKVDESQKKTTATFKDLRESMGNLCSKDELKRLQERTKSGFKQAEEKLARARDVRSLTNQVEHLKEKLSVMDGEIQDVTELKEELAQQREDTKRMLELVELLSKKMVI